MNLPFCGCGQPLWAQVCQERGFCEHCRIHHSVHWPEFGYHPRAFPYLLPDSYDPEKRGKPVSGLHLARADCGIVIHRHDCVLLDGNQVPWLWAGTVGIGEILYAAEYFGYGTCRQCHPLASYDSTVV